jgi:tripartite-type tricarboxylate transporter receptor subunit TctC
MKFPRYRFLHPASVAAAVAVLSVTLSAHGAWSQAARTVKIVVPIAPGGLTDILARLLAEQIGRAQGPTMVVENRPGAGTVIGTEAVSRAAPDGNTVLITTPAFVINPHLRKLNYDPLTSFEPICDLVSAPMVIVVNSASPYRTLADLLSAASAKPGDLTLASLPGSLFQIAFEMLKRAANVNMTFVPYPGAAPAVNALLGGHVTSVFVNYSDAVEQMKAGKLRALATAGRKRIEALPDVPTVVESGYKDVEAEGWFGLFAPAKTPKDAVSQLGGWFTAALRTPEIKAKLLDQGIFPVGVCGAQFGAFIRKINDDYGRVSREANIKAE